MQMELYATGGQTGTLISYISYIHESRNIQTNRHDRRSQENALLINITKYLIPSRRLSFISDGERED